MRGDLDEYIFLVLVAGEASVYLRAKSGGSCRVPGRART